MKVFIMRHAQASLYAAYDKDRPITDLGVKQTKEILQGNATDLSGIRLIWTSDLLRAKQTSQIAADIFGLEVSEKTFLSPDGDPLRVLSELNELDLDTSILIVSHQPLVGELASLLVHGNFKHLHPYDTSELLSFDLELAQPGMATLLNQYTPDY